MFLKVYKYNTGHKKSENKVPFEVMFHSIHPQPIARQRPDIGLPHCMPLRSIVSY